MKQTLRINDYEVWVHLGCLTEEQKHAQPVHFTLELRYLKNLTGTHTDNLADTTDYVHLVEIIKKTAQRKSYHLIEHLNCEVFLELISELKKNKVSVEAQLTVRKIRVPVENLKNGVEFSCQLTLS